MCIAFFLLDVHPKLLFLLAFNRDEQYLGIMFAMLAVACYQSLQQSPPWRRWN